MVFLAGRGIGRACRRGGLRRRGNPRPRVARGPGRRPTRSGRTRALRCRGSSRRSSSGRTATKSRPSCAAFRARKRLDASRRRLRRLALASARSSTRRSAPPTSSRASTRTCADPALEVPFGIFHQRFSTNTEPSWERAQPFRLLCHNGEINAIRGNVNWMRARSATLGWDIELDGPVLDETSSDSGMLDNALELLVRGGRDVRHAFAMLDPAGVAVRTRSSTRRRARVLPLPRRARRAVGRPGRRRLHRRPLVGAALDRNGLRPLRYARRRTTSSSARPRSASSTCRKERRCSAGGSGPGEHARRRSRARPAGERRDQERARRTRAVRRVARRMARARHDRRARTRARRRPHRAARCSSATRARSSRRSFARSAAHGARADVVDGRRHGAAAARRPCAAALQLLPPALRAGDEPGDRPHPRALRHVAPDAARRPRAAAPRSARRLRPGSRSRASSSSPPRSRTSRYSGSTPRSRRSEGLEAACRRIGDEAEAGDARGPRHAAALRQRRVVRAAADPDAARDLGSPPPARSRRASRRSRRSSSRATSRARRTTLRACSASAPRRSARDCALQTVAHAGCGRQARRRPAVRPRRRSSATARRSRTAC